MKLTNLNIVWYVLCWNEMPILPFMIDYWKQIANKVIVYDNKSTDGSVEYLKQYDWIEVRPYPIDTNNEMNDDIHRKIKDECWKEQRGKNVDWVIVSDLDETIWTKNFDELLNWAKNNGGDVLIPKGYDFVSQTFPEYKPNELLHNQIKTCTRITMWDKPIIFNPDNVDEIYYCVGGHKCSAITKNKILTVDNLYLFHFKYLSSEYLINKRMATVPRMSDINKRNRWGFEYLFTKQQMEEQFNERWKNAKDFSVDELLK